MSRISSSLGRSASSASASTSASASAASAASGPDSAEKPFKAVLQVAQQQAVMERRKPPTPVQSVPQRGAKGSQEAAAKTGDAAKGTGDAAEGAQSEKIAEPDSSVQPVKVTLPKLQNSTAGPRTNSVVTDNSAATARSKPASEQMTANAPTSVGQQDTSDQHGQSADKDHLKNGKAPFHATDAAPDGAVSSAVVVASQPWVTVVQPPVQAAVARQSAAASAQQTAAEDAATGGTSANANTSVARAAAQSAPGTSLRGKSSGAAASAVKGDGSHPSTQQSDSSAAKDSAPPVTDALLAQASIVPAPIAAPTPQITAISAQPVVSSSATIQHASIAPEAAFVASNHPPIVMGIHGQLMPDGGNMSIRLAPPELGDLQINVQVSSGSVAASFQTSNDQATRLLSHSLGQLKTSLEAAGVNVERLQVSQMPRESAKQETNSNNNGNQSQQEKTQADSEAGARDQQRREMLRRMWQKVSGKDDIDLVA